MREAEVDEFECAGLVLEEGVVLSEEVDRPDVGGWALRVFGRRLRLRVKEGGGDALDGGGGGRGGVQGFEVDEEGGDASTEVGVQVGGEESGEFLSCRRCQYQSTDLNG